MKTDQDNYFEGDKKEKARSREKTEPESGTALTSNGIKGAGDQMSTNFFYYSGRYIARFDPAKKTVYRSPDINTVELQAIHVWATRKGSQTIIKCADDSDFVAHDAGGDKLIKENELDKIASDIEKSAFDYCKALIPQLESAIKYFHVKDGHVPEFKRCRHAVCATNHEVNARIDRELFHGTLEEMTGVKP